jgi:hypothetical protein
MNKTFKNINFLNYKKEFLDKIYPLMKNYPSNSLFYSEGLALYTLAKEFKIDLLIESGVFRGGSTRIWVNTLPEINIECIDILESSRHIPIVEEVIKKFSKHKNINFTIGDSNIELPKIIKNNPNKTIGVFVDGPKDNEGLNLCKKVLEFSNVKFSCLHDFSMLNDEKHFSTRTNQSFNEQIRGINANHPQINKYPDGPGLYCLLK